MNPLATLVAISLLTTGLVAQQQPSSRQEPGVTTAKDLRRLAVLLEREPKAHLQTVARATWSAPSSRVRVAATELLVRRKLHGAAVEHVAPALRHSDARVRAQAAEALARLGYPQARELLGLPAKKGEGGSTAPRQHVAFLEQQAILRDFHVEVA